MRIDRARDGYNDGGFAMLASHTISDALPIETDGSLVRRFLRALPPRHRVRKVIATDDEGNVIGTVIAPKHGEVFGRGRGCVLLNR
jgi:hypothetical protein